MKKVITIFLSLILMLSMSTTAFAYTIEFNNGPANSSYNRTSALNYLNSYTITANPAYYDYTGPDGGDCTNFVSQMLRAGGMRMTAQTNSPTNADWYYYGPNLPYRTSSWTGAGFFRTYWGVVNGVGYKKANAMYKFTNSELKNNTNGAYTSLVSLCEVGDVIQFVSASGSTYHSMGVQRVYYENGVRKVTISQHTSNNFFHLTDKINQLSSSGWVCLLKSKAASSTYTVEQSSNTLQSMLHFMDEGEILELIGNMPVAFSSELYIDDIPTETLSHLFSELQTVQTHSNEDDDDKWKAIQKIGEALEKKYQEESEINPIQINNGIISKDHLIKLIGDKMDMCKAILQTPEPVDETLLENGAVMSFADEQKATAELLETLIDFLEEVNKNATQENIYSYWNSFWINILQDKVPSGYVLAE